MVPDPVEGLPDADRPDDTAVLVLTRHGVDLPVRLPAQGASLSAVRDRRRRWLVENEVTGTVVRHVLLARGEAAGALLETLTAAADRHRPAKPIVDPAGTPYVDSAGVELLFRPHAGLVTSGSSSSHRSTRSPRACCASCAWARSRRGSRTRCRCPAHRVRAMIVAVGT